MAVLGVLAIGAMLVLGLVAFLVVASIVVVLAAIVGLRIWWHNRRIHKEFYSGGKAVPRGNDPQIIDGEYYTVPTRSERERKEDRE
jgi:hypothetical protein